MVLDFLFDKLYKTKVKSNQGTVKATYEKAYKLKSSDQTTGEKLTQQKLLKYCSLSGKETQ